MVRTVAVSRTRIITEPKSPPGRHGRATTTEPAGSARLSVRKAAPGDLPWLQAWTTQLGLPVPKSGRVRSFILLEDEKRIGYLAGRPSLLDLGRGREPVMWIVAAFLIPAKRGRGLITRFGEILSRQEYPAGKVAARIAIDNTRMHRFMSKGRWKKLRTTRRYVEYALELTEPFRANRR